VKARARGIGHHDVGGHSLGDQRGQDEANFSGEKRAVGDPLASD
jgi:hypothetical protein